MTLHPTLLAAVVLARKRWDVPNLYVEMSGGLDSTYRLVRCWFQAGKAIRVRPVSEWDGCLQTVARLELGEFDGAKKRPALRAKLAGTQ